MPLEETLLDWVNRASLGIYGSDYYVAARVNQLARVILPPFQVGTGLSSKTYHSVESDDWLFPKYFFLEVFLIQRQSLSLRFDDFLQEMERRFIHRLNFVRPWAFQEVFSVEIVLFLSFQAL